MRRSRSLLTRPLRPDRHDPTQLAISKQPSEHPHGTCHPARRNYDLLRWQEALSLDPIPGARSADMCIGNGRAALLALVCSAAIVGCSEDDAVAPTSAGPALSEADLTTLAAEVRALTAGRGIGPLARPTPVRPALVELGRALAFDKILSGNKDISCMTCHLPGFATGDGRSLSIGQGGDRPGRRCGCTRRGHSSRATRRRLQSVRQQGAVLGWPGGRSMRRATSDTCQRAPDAAMAAGLRVRGALGACDCSRCSRAEMRAASGTSSRRSRTTDRTGLDRADGAASARFRNIGGCSRLPIRARDSRR